jgi:trk system potassium uptake protein TrkH
MATGGFVPLNASIAAFPSPFVQYTVIFFMLLAGTNFSLHYWALKGKPGHYTKNPEFRLYIGIIVGATFLIMLIKS